jgi:hypothetical protein
MKIMHSNEEQNDRLSEAQVERLAILGEELAESGQVIGKILRHGYESRHPDEPETNRERLMEEVGHVVAAVMLAVAAGDVGGEVIRWHAIEKLVGMRPWLRVNEPYARLAEVVAKENPLWPFVSLDILTPVQAAAGQAIEDGDG